MNVGGKVTLHTLEWCIENDEGGDEHYPVIGTIILFHTMQEHLGKTLTVSDLFDGGEMVFEECQSPFIFPKELIKK